MPSSVGITDADLIRDSARGRWRSTIYPALGIEAGNGKHRPCPACGGTDRFRCDDLDGSGSHICNQCGAGDGFSLVMKVRGCDFPTALNLVFEVLHVQINGTSHKLGKIVSVHDFTDEHSTLIFQECRYEPKDFRLRKPDGKGGYTWALGNAPRVLYRLPDIHQQTSSPVVLHEGPGCVDAARAAGLPGVHTTSAGGANAPHKTDFSPLKGRDLVICPDHDEPGEKYFRDVVELAQKAGAKSVRVLRLPGLPPKGDVIDWLNAGGTSEQFLTLLEEAEPIGATEPPPGLASALLEYSTLVTLDLPSRKQHLPWLSEAGNAMVFGPRGVGKTWFQLGLAASLVTGADFLKWKTDAPVGVLYVDGEMPLRQLRDRMTALLPSPPKAHLKFLSSEMVYHHLKRDLILSSEDVRDEVVGILDAHPDIRALIFDNISTLFTGIDEDRKRDWEPVAGWFIRLRHRGLTTVLVHHAGKGGQQRGTSGREDALDTVVALSRPSTHEAKEGCHFEVKFEKCRSVKGDTVGPLDVKLTETSGVLTWTYKDLELSKEEQVRELLADGLTSNAEIAEALGITRAYVWKLRKKIKQGGGQ